MVGAVQHPGLPFNFRFQKGIRRQSIRAGPAPLFMVNLSL